jgi:hypothetical protein
MILPLYVEDISDGWRRLLSYRIIFYYILWLQIMKLCFVSWQIELILRTESATCSPNSTIGLDLWSSLQWNRLGVYNLLEI